MRFFKIILRRRRIKEGPTKRTKRKHYLKYKESARIVIHERAQYFSQTYGVRVGRISIRDQKTRWGSCSKKGNLNFNYKLALLPSHLRDYVIVHEICHLIEFNHSKKFWAQVERAAPEWRKARRELRLLTMSKLHS